MGDEAAATEFHCSKIGMPFIGEGAQVTDEMLANCRKGHTTKDAPPKVGGTRLITMGADQGKTGYISVVEWFFDRPPGSDINTAAIGKLLWFGHFQRRVGTTSGT